MLHQISQNQDLERRGIRRTDKRLSVFTARLHQFMQEVRHSQANCLLKSLILNRRANIMHVRFFIGQLNVCCVSYYQCKILWKDYFSFRRLQPIPFTYSFWVHCSATPSVMLFSWNKNQNKKHLYDMHDNGVMILHIVLLVLCLVLNNNQSTPCFRIRSSCR